MNSKKLKIFFDKDFFILAAVLALNLLFQRFILQKLGQNGVIAVIGYNMALISIIFLVFHVKKIQLYLVIIYLAPYIYLNNLFHYLIKNEIILTLPIFILVLFAAWDYLQKGQVFYIRKERFLKVALYLLLASLLAVVTGMVNKNEYDQIIIENYRVFNYGLIFIFLYFFRTRKDWMIIFKAMFLISLFVSFEYILVFLMGSDSRFVTFQMNYFPLIAGVLCGYILFEKDRVKKILWGGLLLIIVVGAFVTLTRAVWVATFIVFGILALVYLKDWMKISNRKLILVALLSVMLLGIIAYKVKPPKLTSASIDKVEYRASSIFDPSSDISFLMRIELNFHAFMRFMDNPVLGKGHGDWVKYIFIPANPYKQYYLDNSWIQLFWKGGIILGGLFIILYYLGIRNAYYVFRHSKNKLARIYCLGIFAGLISFLFLGMLSPFLIKYKANVLLAFILAYVEFEKQQIPEQNEITGV